MSSIGTGYDLAASTFSPDGRIFQVEYAAKAVESSVTVIALSSKKGVVVAVDQPIPSKLDIEGANSRIMRINNKIGFVGSGLFPDVFALCDYARDESRKYYKEFDRPLTVKKLAGKVAEHVHIYTLGISRPFGASTFILSWDEKVAEHVHIYTLGISRPFGASTFILSWDEKVGSSIYCIESSGQCYKYFGWAIGKNAQAAKTEIEKVQEIDGQSNLGKEELIKRAIHVLLTTREEGTTGHRIKMGWIGEDSNEVFEGINQSEVDKLEEEVSQQMEDEED
uniref:Proteasome subunit alpha type n=1 Tax=Meloidogyne incognita TaxID=6306 RepID=A0A914KZX5_MELIC